MPRQSDLTALLLAEAAVEAEIAVRRSRPSTPMVIHTGQHLAAQVGFLIHGTVVTLIGRRGSRYLKDIVKALRAADAEAVGAACDVALERVDADFEAASALFSYAEASSIVNVAYGASSLVKHALLLPSTELVMSYAVWSGGKVENERFTVTDCPSERARDTEVEVLVLLVDPKLTEVERAVLEAVPTELSELHISSPSVAWTTIFANNNGVEQIFDGAGATELQNGEGPDIRGIQQIGGPGARGVQQIGDPDLRGIQQIGGPGGRGVQQIGDPDLRGIQQIGGPGARGVQQIGDPDLRGIQQIGGPGARGAEQVGGPDRGNARARMGFPFQTTRLLGGPFGDEVQNRTTVRQEQQQQADTRQQQQRQVEKQAQGQRVQQQQDQQVGGQQQRVQEQQQHQQQQQGQDDFFRRQQVQQQQRGTVQQQRQEDKAVQRNADEQVERNQKVHEQQRQGGTRVQQNREQERQDRYDGKTNHDVRFRRGVDGLRLHDFDQERYATLLERIDFESLDATQSVKALIRLREELLMQGMA